MQINLKLTALQRLSNSGDPDYEILRVLKEVTEEASGETLKGKEPSDMQELGDYFGLSDQRIEEMKDFVTNLI